MHSGFSATAPVAPTTFTRFSDLPPEIRVRIWKMAEPGSRILRFKWQRYIYSKAPPVYHPKGVLEQLTALQNRKESRIEALNRYIRFSGFCFRPYKFYIDPCNNALYFEPNHPSYLLAPNHTLDITGRRIRSILIDSTIARAFFTALFGSHRTVSTL